MIFRQPHRLLRARFLATALALTAAVAGLAEPGRPALVNLDYDDLLAIRDDIREGNPEVQPAYAALIKAADALLPQAPDSVVNKDRLPPSGDRHDFFAIGKYAWPNPGTPDGMPWIRRDGHVNEDAHSAHYDMRRYATMRIRANTLAHAWFFSRDERYAARAADVLRTWFIAPATRMNPNFNYAASLPGVHDGMAIGIIEGAELIGLLDSVKLLALSESWTPEDDAALRRWFADYTTWLLESGPGREESRATDNHGAWYAAQIAAFSLYAGDIPRVEQMLQRARELVAIQLNPDGSLKRELRRNRSFNYSVYGLRGLVALARCGDAIGEGLWHWRTADGLGLELAFAFLAPYLAGEKPWEWPELDPTPNPLAIQIVRLGARAYATDPALRPKLVRASAHLATLRPKTDRVVWLLGRTPSSP